MPYVIIEETLNFAQSCLMYCTPRIFVVFIRSRIFIRSMIFSSRRTLKPLTVNIINA